MCGSLGRYYAVMLEKGSILGPTRTDPRIARPGQVLKVITNCSHLIILHLSPVGTGPRSPQDKRSEWKTHAEQAPGGLPPDTSVWKSHQALPGTPALRGKKTERVRSPADREIKPSFKNKTEQRHTVNFLCHQSTWKLVS